MQLKVGGKFHLKLNTGERPIANKYREGKMKSTLKRELKGPEIVSREPIGASVVLFQISFRIRLGMHFGLHRSTSVGVVVFSIKEGGYSRVSLSLDM